MNVKINISFDHRSLLAVPVTRVVRQCILATLQEEKVPVPCEINVLLTDDGGIHAINLATRQVDRPTDVLSFPMFQLTPGVCLGIGAITWTRRRACALWGTWPSPWSGPKPRPQNLAIQSAGRWDISPSTPCCICWATTTWTRDLRRPKCAPTRRPSSAPLIYIDKNK